MSSTSSTLAVVATCATQTDCVAIESGELLATYSLKPESVHIAVVPLVENLVMHAFENHFEVRTLEGEYRFSCMLPFLTASETVTCAAVLEYGHGFGDEPCAVFGTNKRLIIVRLLTQSQATAVEMTQPIKGVLTSEAVIISWAQRCVQLWSIEKSADRCSTLKEARLLEFHADVKDVAFSGETQRLILATADCILVVCTETGRRLAAVRFDGIVSLCCDKQMDVIVAATSHVLKRIHFPTLQMKYPTTNPFVRRLLETERTDEEPLTELNVHYDDDANITGVALTADGCFVIVVSNGKLVVFDMEAGVRLWTKDCSAGDYLAITLANEKTHVGSALTAAGETDMGSALTAEESDESEEFVALIRTYGVRLDEETERVLLWKICPNGYRYEKAKGYERRGQCLLCAARCELAFDLHCKCEEKHHICHQCELKQHVSHGFSSLTPSFECGLVTELICVCGSPMRLRRVGAGLHECQHCGELLMAEDIVVCCAHRGAPGAQCSLCTDCALAVSEMACVKCASPMRAVKSDVQRSCCVCRSHEDEVIYVCTECPLDRAFRTCIDCATRDDITVDQKRMALKRFVYTCAPKHCGNSATCFCEGLAQATRGSPLAAKCARRKHAIAVAYFFCEWNSNGVSLPKDIKYLIWRYLKASSSCLVDGDYVDAIVEIPTAFPFIVVVAGIELYAMGKICAPGGKLKSFTLLRNGSKLSIGIVNKKLTGRCAGLSFTVQLSEKPATLFVVKIDRRDVINVRTREGLLRVITGMDKFVQLEDASEIERGAALELSSFDLRMAKPLRPFRKAATGRSHARAAAKSAKATKRTKAKGPKLSSALPKPRTERKEAEEEKCTRLRTCRCPLCR